jgi:uncharacterized protein YukE
MGNDFTPGIKQAIAIAGKVGLGAALSDTFEELWGDPGKIHASAEFWKSTALAAERVASQIDAEKEGMSDDHWEGVAKTAYVKWLNDLKGQVELIQSGIWDLGTDLEAAVEVIKDMQAELEHMALWLVGLVGGTVIAVKADPKLGLALVGLAVLELIDNLNSYRNTAGHEFAKLATQVRDQRRKDANLITRKDGFTPGPIKLPVVIQEPAPVIPIEQTGDWHNWGSAHPQPER